MTKVTQIAVREANAARMLDIQRSDFRRLVSLGALPPPVTVAGDIELWLVDDLRAILTGSAARPSQDFEL
ncbi:MAG: hypothetical protein P1U75_14400 [Antarcticimicrobium sp.]|uniref:hypothetical protein n=1 Tax=Antarcticimicrobium sp. TaxID=2824147 RepID=UPI002625303F|nr:hypothetical protein [Antarcticimicrobium sp.]MDF1717843.1 hypothetical protein [Antarcticimicrobium sp.]